MKVWQEAPTGDKDALLQSRNDIPREGLGAEAEKEGSSFVDTLRDHSAKPGIFSSSDDDGSETLNSSESSKEDGAEHRSETSAMFMCGAFFFLMLANYQLQVVRDSHVLFVGTSLSAKLLAWTTVCSFFVAPFSKLAVKSTIQATARSIQLFYRVFGAIILTSSLVSLDSTAHTFLTTIFVSCFYVVTQSVNNLVISVLWSFSSDLVPLEQSVRYFSMFGASCTLGQAAGSMLASGILAMNVPVSFLAFWIAMALECAGRSAYMAAHKSPEGYVGTRASRGGTDKSSRSSSSSSRDFPPSTTTRKQPPWWKRLATNAKALGVSFLDPYIMMIALYTLCYTASMSLIYLTRSKVVGSLGLSLEESSALSARINLFTAVLTFVVQILLTT